MWVRWVSKSGFSLVEVVIAVALVALAAAAFMLIGDGLSKGYQREKINGQSFAITDRIRELLSYEGSCRLAFGGPSVYGGPVNHTTQKMVRGAVTPNIILYVPTSPPSQVFLNAQTPDPTTQPNTLGDWTITSLTLTAANPGIGVSCPGSVPAYLSYTGIPTFNLANPTLPAVGAGRIVQNIFLTVKLDAACNIISCYPITYGTDGNPIPVCSRYETATAVGPHVECRLTSCPTGTSPQGADAYGNIICAPGRIVCIPNNGECTVGGQPICCSENCNTPITGGPSVCQ